MAANRNNGNKYEALYTELMSRGEQLHESNRRRIRRGLAMLVIIPVVLGFIRWITDSDKVVFLIIWILLMFAHSAYLITIEYLDNAVEKTLKKASEAEAEEAIEELRETAPAEIITAMKEAFDASAEKEDES